MHRPAVCCLVLAFLIGAAACKKSASDNNTSSSPSLIGSWNWVLTVNDGFSTGAWTGNPFGDSTTPASTGIQETLTFNADSTWTLLQNSSLVERGRFKIYEFPSPGGLLPMLDLIRAGGPDSLVDHSLSTSKDTLAISNPEIDSVGRVRLYVRGNSAGGNQ